MTNSTNTSVSSKAMNNTAKVSAMSQALFNKGLMPKQAIALSAALIELKDKVGHKNWARVMERTLRNIPFMVDGVEESGADIPNWLEVLTSANLIQVDGDTITTGWYLDALYEEKPKAYPRPASEGIVERRRKLKNACHGMVSAIEILEATQYTVDVTMVKLAMRVYAKLGKGKLTSEQYVIDGCYKLVNEGNVPVVSEFFDDMRGRLYQGDGHGPNGQSSDMARAFMNLHGEGMEYDHGVARKLIMDEIADMVSSKLDVEKEIKSISSLSFSGLSEYMVTTLRDNRSLIKKVWSFIKAAGLIIKLDRGETPYIGMAFGLDAKCSGPQLAALMTDDEELANACGFTDKDVADAYERTLNILDSSWATVGRGDIKRPFMATFYGQSWQALTISDNYGRTKKSDMEMVVLDCMLNDAGVDRDTSPDMVQDIVQAHWCERAKELNEAIEKSFGKVSSLRKAVKEAHGSWEKDMEGKSNWVAKTHKATCHSMPDGVKVEMKYFKAVDVNGLMQDYGMVAPTVELTLKGEDMKFNHITFKTKVVDLARHARAGFVNMVQATDGQLARLIIRHLDALGVKNIVAVHDCFRVGINDMIAGTLEKAIRYAYTNLFGCVENRRTNMLPKGSDIVGMYFQGVNKSKMNAGYVHSQFEDGERTLHDFMDMPELINMLGNGTSFFAK